MSLLDKKIEEAKSQLSKLEAEKVSLENTPPAQRLVDHLHKRFCHWNHTDGCGWMYETWEKPDFAHQDWLDKTINLVGTVNDIFPGLSIGQVQELLDSFAETWQSQHPKDLDRP